MKKIVEVRVVVELLFEEEMMEFCFFDDEKLEVVIDWIKDMLRKFVKKLKFKFKKLGKDG